MPGGAPQGTSGYAHPALRRMLQTALAQGLQQLTSDVATLQAQIATKAGLKDIASSVTSWLSANPQAVKGDKGDRGDVGATGQPGRDGVDGRNGISGKDGANGVDGKSAYQQAIDNGFAGTIPAWLASLKGAKGDAGAPGVSIKGDTGATGPAGSNATATPLATTAPLGLAATAAVGTSANAARADHVHPLPGLTTTALGTLTITKTASLVAIAAGVQRVTFTGVSGLLATDLALIIPEASMPTAYAIHNAIVTGAGALTVVLTGPLLAIGASYSFTAKLVVLR
jgi:hypothetical protein